jgi:putative ABC transport system permease protein
MWQDIRFGLRLLRKAPGFTLAAVASLGLGIGFNTSIFAVLDAVLLRPLPVAEPHRLVEIYTSSSDGDTYATNSLPDLIDFRDQLRAQVFEDVAGRGRSRADCDGRGGHRELLHHARREGASRTHADARR